MTLDSWASESGLRDRLLTVWDGGGDPSAVLLSHSAALFSGDGQLADDVIVQAVGFIPGKALLFSSDLGLRSRCYAQRLRQAESGDEMGEAAAEFASATHHQLQAEHSIYLNWILEAYDTTHSDRTPGENPGHSKRREKTRAFASSLRLASGAENAHRTVMGSEEEDADRGGLCKVVRWFDSRSPAGMSEQKTRKGNSLYSLETTLQDTMVQGD
eukprot:gnl/TRDRNA2_/TRDRNA2_171688_c0_seq4.p1 gnl/TRDRNA2_/TRDRNA2_171688_c0~~gnl/TRDRNA2_/TRDRNA2_171688_c0_seq4.p1  ORF type:complete len:214 (-),score=37.18 gnl/TRDRNA2_/TRDRNA2_171688_c0_seq4:64-705(-)